MESLELERLYLLYKSGATAEPDKSRPEKQRELHGDLLQVARATGEEITLEDFAFIAMQIEALAEMKNKEWPESAANKPGGHQGKLEGWLSNRDYQSKIWELPEYFRSRNAPFRPKRTASNEPVESAMPATAQEAVTPAVPPMPVVNPAEVRQAINQSAREQGIESDASKPVAIAPKRSRSEIGESVRRQAKESRVSTDAAKVDIGERKGSFGFNMPRFSWLKTKPIAADGAKSSASPAIVAPQSAAGPQSEPSQQADTQWLDDPKAWAKQIRQQIVEDTLKPRRSRESENDASDGSPGESPANQSGGSPLLDTLQSILDAVGVVDPTPITDGANMFVSLGRAVFDPGNAGSHLVNAATSAVSMVPYVGDLAKLGKYGGKAAAKASTHAASAGAKAGAHSASNVIPPPVQPASVNGVTPPPVQGPASVIPPPVQGGAGGGGAPPGGGGGLGTMFGDFINNFFGQPAKWLGVGAVIAFGFKTAIEQGQAALSLLKPDKYTGDAFDSTKNAMNRFDKTVDATMPIAKYLPFEQIRRKAFQIIQGIIDWLQSVEQTGKQMIEKNRNLAEYSGTIAVAFNQLDVDRIRRDISKADAMGGDFKNLSASQSAFESAKQDLFQPFERLQIFLQSKLLDLGTVVMRGVDKIEYIGELIDWWLGYAKDTDARNGLEDSIQKLEQPPKKRI